MTGIDPDRLAEALLVSRLHVHTANEQLVGHESAALILAETYDRLTAEWQARIRSVNLSPKAVPTRRKG